MPTPWRDRQEARSRGGTAWQREGRVDRPPPAAARAAALRQRRPATEPRSVLVVEDETLVALAVGDALEQAGYVLRGIAATEAEAHRLAGEEPPDFAVVDITLGPGNSGLNVGWALAQRGVTVLYATAYAAGFRQEMEDTGGRACLLKPFLPEEVPASLGVLERLGRGEAAGRLPPAFHWLVD